MSYVLESCGKSVYNKRSELASAADVAAKEDVRRKEANPLYPVPRLMTRQELEQFYYQVADWSEQNDR